MANKKGKEIDNTHLSIDFAEKKGFIHRDYIAHCLRWSFVAKYLRQGKRFENAHILDVGCGRDQPLIRTLYSGMLVPKSYTGVDYNKLTLHPSLESVENTGRFELNLQGNCDFAECELDWEEEYGLKLISRKDSTQWVRRPNLVTSFEVLEHVEPAHAKRIMKNIHRVLTDDGVAIISTPNWDGKRAAANHVNEMRHEALGRMLLDCGFKIREVYGTFMNQADFKRVVASDSGLPYSEAIGLLNTFNKLHAYHDSNVLANIFAPMFPKAARNALWVLTKQGFNPESNEVPSDFNLSENLTTLQYTTDWDKIEKPWTSSEKWKELAE